MAELCTVADCRRNRYARGYCALHYKRVLRHGDAERVAPKGTRALCAVAGCDRATPSRGWCHAHYQRWRRHGDVDEARPLRTRAVTCRIEGCHRRAYARVLCQPHYRRHLNGDTRDHVPVRAVTGAGTLSHGYWYVNVPPDERHLSNGERKLGEHRYVMAKHLGRPLHADEVVHHINGDRTDNRLENLELWSSAHPRGQRIIDKVTFALDMLRRYRPDLLSAAAPRPDDGEEAVP